MENNENTIATQNENSATVINMLNKIPEVTIYFWIIKILATTVGETAANLLTFNLNWGLTNTTLLMSVLLLIGLFFQFKQRKYIPSIYWLVVVLVSIVGTLITDNLSDNYGVALQTTTIVFSIALLVTFMIWYASEKNLSIHSINSIHREAFYWLAVLLTFTLGTAAGDLLSKEMNLGYWKSGLIFAAIITAVSVAYFGFKLNSVLAFWMAYILTRPFGASIGDFLSQPRSNGGLGLGTVGTSAIFLLILCLVIYLTRPKKIHPSQLSAGLN